MEECLSNGILQQFYIGNQMIAILICLILKRLRFFVAKNSKKLTTENQALSYS